MKLPNTIISLIFNEIKQNEWIKVYFLFIDEIEWKINHLKKISRNYKLEKNCLNKNIFTIFKNKNKNNNLNWCDSNLLYKVCEDGNLKIIKLIINIFPTKCYYWDEGLDGACASGDLNIVKLIISKKKFYPVDFDCGLGKACRYGHLNIVKLMIKLGANNWNTGLAGACRFGHLNIVNLMIQKGADYCFYCEKSIEDHLNENFNYKKRKIN